MYKSVLKRAAVAATALALPLVLASNDARAFNYPKQLSNGKVCRVVLGTTHWHTGDASDPSKAAAQARAIRHWSRFVVFEYGRKYGNWNAADKQSMTCAHDKDAGVWRCRAQAQPCRG